MNFFTKNIIMQGCKIELIFSYESNANLENNIEELLLHSLSEKHMQKLDNQADLCDNIGGNQLHIEN